MFSMEWSCLLRKGLASFMVSRGGWAYWNFLITFRIVINWKEIIELKLKVAQTKLQKENNLWRSSSFTGTTFHWIYNVTLWQPTFFMILFLWAPNLILMSFNSNFNNQTVSYICLMNGDCILIFS